ncbi:VOC family protein [Streptomyces sp. SID5910]|uniref:VOC family protein n=1 Tax=Streptomyces sp. SID5910 TaxID=2690312 RepID=UPI00136994F8|nr:VOC family protein [Streptomyces sp. SID5910]MYR44542.1 VOC family protein [Streptomyces sp. SID5910]
MTTTENTSAPAFRYSAVTFDCSDPAAMAHFWGEALGLPVAFSTDDFYLLGGKDGAAGLGFNRLADYRRPTWPDPAQEKQAHIDLGTDDLDAAEARLLALGATKPDFQPDPDRWRVLLDPAGHPFCVSTVA